MKRMNRLRKNIGILQNKLAEKNTLIADYNRKMSELREKHLNDIKLLEAKIESLQISAQEGT